MSNKKFPPKPDECEMLFHVSRTYGNTLKKSDLFHLGCGGSYKKYLSEGIIKEESDHLNPKITIPDPYRKLE